MHRPLGVQSCLSLQVCFRERPGRVLVFRLEHVQALIAGFDVRTRYATKNKKLGVQMLCVGFLHEHAYLQASCAHMFST